MLRFEKDFPGAEIVRLEQNYRSTGNILKAANGLIEKNASRLGKSLWTQDPDGEPIALYAAFNEYDEAEFVANRMREHIDGPQRYSDIAVLYRSNAQSSVLEEILIRHRIPYRIYGGLRFFERQEIKDALAWLRLLKNRDDDTCFERAVGTPPRGVGATTLEKIREIAKASQVSLWSAAKNASNQLGRSSGKVLEFLAGVEALAKETASMRLSDATELVIARTGLREHYRKEKGEQAESRLENLDELVSAARGFEINPGAHAPDQEGEPEPEMDPLTAFLTHAALESGEEQAGPGEDGVQLMTLHAAKGLEFPIVFVVGVENGIFPSMRAVEEGNLEEERRLCYVGLTRAKKKLYLSYAEIRRVHGVEQLGAPSMFLREIPQECLVEVRPRAGLLRPAPFGGTREREGSYGSRGYGSARPDYDGLRPMARPRPVPGGDTSTGPGGFKLGQRVEHGKFGEGTILAFDGDGDRARVEVRFGRESKWLVLSFANLRAV
jgi:DNA helicase-2/ATP-dependent DNA helicase PcrA